jgi:hypothetical protein
LLEFRANQTNEVLAQPDPRPSDGPGRS